MKSLWNKQWNVYLAVLYLLTLPITAGFLIGRYKGFDFWRGVYLASSWLAFTALVLLPLLVPRLLGCLPKLSSSKIGRPTLLVLTTLIAFAIHSLLFADLGMLSMFGYHLNGLVLNLLMTPGGFASMGLEWNTLGTLGAAALALLLAEVLLVRFSFCSEKADKIAGFFQARSYVLPLAYGAVALCLALALLITGVADYKSAPNVLCAVETFPAFPALRMRKLLHFLGVEQPRREHSVQFAAQHSDSNNLSYPASPIVRSAEHPKYNIIWLVGESLRADLLSAETMPSTWKLAQGAWRFTQHYSGGHGTRESMFSMFYGLYGNCWHTFLRRSRPPLLFSWLRDDGYHFLCQTSARFSYPEFDRTVFAAMKDSELKEFDRGSAWERDIHSVDAALKFIREQDVNQPFFLFCFFESTHAPYSFPEQSAVRHDYLKAINYATVKKADAPRLYNRAVNAAHHIDGQIGRLLALLAEKPQMAERTIILITGDHGEEFYEKGRLGHNSTFVQEQLRIPLVIAVPKMQPHVYEQMSHHTDIIPTLAPLFGVTNPASDFSVGGNLFDEKYSRRSFISCGWDTAVFATRTHKLLLPFGKKRFFSVQNLTTLNDAPCNDIETFYKENAAELGKAQRDMYRFISGRKE
jgi:membrane-anchored protein YejM (alkaline phosphatase superfamily)